MEAAGCAIEAVMNAPDINRSILRMHIAAIEAKYPIKIVGIVTGGTGTEVVFPFGVAPGSVGPRLLTPR